MNDTPNSSPSDAQRDAVFTSWVQRLLDAKRSQNPVVAKVSPWRHQFAKAVALGCTWDELAKEVATKPEIGVNVTGGHLRKCVAMAFTLANEKPPKGVITRRHRRAKRKAADGATAGTAKS